MSLRLHAFRIQGYDVLPVVYVHVLPVGYPLANSVCSRAVFKFKYKTDI